MTSGAGISPIAFLIATLIFAIVLVVLIRLLGKPAVKLDTDAYRRIWLEVSGSVTSDVSSWQLAILNADKLLDKALREKGSKGETMGERMKAMRDHFSNNNSVWTAHKLRNQIAHEQNVQLSRGQTDKALAAYRQALQDIGAL